MIAAGIDIGGTKIEVQGFAADWTLSARHRVPTPQDYDALVTAIADQARWMDAEAGHPLPIGIGAAGLVDPRTGLAITANLSATGRPLPRDVAAALGRPITWLNDCRAMALSEAVFGAGQGHRCVVSLILGTGVGGGIAFDGTLLPGPLGVGGEFGHFAAPAHLVQEYALPVRQCGCGRIGCFETYVAGPGLSRLAKTVTGQDWTPEAIGASRRTDSGAAQVWDIWCQMTAELLHTLTLVVDPDIVVLAGGLTHIPDLVPDLERYLDKALVLGKPAPRLALAQGGDSSGARGAAFAAYRESVDD